MEAINNEITEDILDAVKVQFLKPIFEDDFPERGMKAWLTKVEREVESDCWKLYFDFTDFEKENDKYLTTVYYDNNSNPYLTAKEAGFYTNKYSVYFGDYSESESFEDQIKKYLKKF